MFSEFLESKINYSSANRLSGTAATDIITADDFSNAINEISQWQGYEATPLYSLENLAKNLNVAAILYKDEGPRFGLGSFKALGGSYAAMRVLQKKLREITGNDVSLEDIREGKYSKQIADITLVSATDGNHGKSLAWGAQNFGAQCRIYIHAEVSEGRANSMSELGALVTRIEGDYDESVRIARKDANDNGWHIVSDTTWEGYVEPPRDVMAGYGVATKEITDELNEAPTHIFLQGGVGGLAASVAAGIRQKWGDNSPRVIIVEPDQADCLFESARQGKATTVKIEVETVMAGLSCGKPSPLAWNIIAEEASDFMTIPDSLVAPTMRLLGNPLGNDPAIIAGESAVAGLAALIAASFHDELRDTIGLDKQSRILLIGSEGATDPEIYKQIML